LVESGGAEELEFSVTFRLDQEQLAFVNDSFRDILNPADGQVDFIELNPRPDVLPGQVVRLDMTPEDLEPKAPETEKARAEAAQLADWIAQSNCEKLRARSWEQVAILCPRKKWFTPIAEALRRVGIDSQIQSETDVKGDSPAHAWFTALLTIMTQPRCGFEIVGVLREVFGLSDHDLAMFSNGYGDRFQIETPTGASDAVSRIIDLLAHLHAEIAHEPLFTAARRIVDSTFLRQRLRTLPAEDFDDLDTELDALLESAAEAEAAGATLEGFAEILQANFATEREASAPRPCAIQLITCQKAKGLEWDAVIVPFFSRRIHTGDEDFPRIIAGGPDGQAIVAFSKGDVPAEKKSALKKAQVQEMERLLYVALTRARHTLVLAADRGLFAKADGKAPDSSLTKWFRSDQQQPNEANFAKLREQAAGCAETRTRQSGKVDSEAQQVAPLPEALLAPAQRRAAEFPQRFFPSSFTPAEPAVESTGADKWKETEFRASIVPSTATRYGLWWHDFVQQIPWGTDPAAWDAVFQSARPDSPDKARSTREWEILRRKIAKLSDFDSGFANDASIFHTEMSFLWATNDRRCLEGIVDLAVFEPAEKKWLILDWKTNDITADKIDKLRAHYRPQLAAYWKAVREMTKMDVEAAIYSTATGALIRYEPEELAREWARLEKLPPDQFNTAVLGDNVSPPAEPPLGQLEFSAFNN
jgi:ATP-dependent exoDNAse (exonuclease V) beta subunit